MKQKKRYTNHTRVESQIFSPSQQNIPNCVEEVHICYPGRNGMIARELTLIQQPYAMREHWDERVQLVALREQFCKVLLLVGDGGGGGAEARDARGVRGG
jgi:16S rRNA C1402 (ribose-2'-O) methylase RsmI